MAAYFLRAVKEVYPNSHVDVIVAKGLLDLLELFPYVDGYHLFSKSDYPGPKGNIQFGKEVQSKRKYDIFFCLPFSFSSALAGFFTASKERIGYRREHRGLLLTSAIKRPKGLHIVEEFVYLLKSHSGAEFSLTPLALQPKSIEGINKQAESDSIILNVKSGPPSRSIPIGKAIDLVRDLLEKFPHQIILTGAPGEVDYISKIKDAFLDNSRLIDLSGKTTLLELFFLISQAKCMVTTDSGNAHVANSVGTPTVVLFGAAHEHRARPYDDSISIVLKNMQLECVPCESERCKYGDVRCLSSIENASILSSVKQLLEKTR